MLNKPQIIDDILDLNPTADREWLNGFSPRSLALYLEHLQVASEPRGSARPWFRPGDSAAIVTRRAAA